MALSEAEELELLELEEAESLAATDVAVKKRAGQIDASRPIIENEDGSFSTEKTITIEQDGKYFNIPTIVGGKERSEDDAVRMFNDGKNAAVGEFSSLEEALSTAKARSSRIGKVREKDRRKSSVARQAEAAVRGVTTGLLGAGDLAAAAGDLVGGQIIRPLVGKERLDPSKTFERVRRERKALEAEAPLASGAGVIAGSLSPIAAIGRGAQALNVGLKAGQPALNTVKTAAAGAAQGGVTAAALGEDVGEGAAFGAVAAPIAGAAVRAGGSAVNFIRSAADKNKDEGFRLLAKSLSKEGNRVAPGDLKARADEFRRVTGRAPTLTEIVGERGAQDIAETVQSGNRAVERLVRSADEQVKGLQKGLAANIVKGRKTPAISKLESYRTIAADNAMKKIGEKTVKFDVNAIKALTESREVRKSLPEVEKELLLALEDSGGELTVRQVDNIRQALRKKTKGPGGPASRMREFASALVDDAGDQVPEYRRFLKSFARRSKAIEGAEMGRKVGPAQTTEFVAALESRSPAGLGGARVGARAALSDAALASPKSAANLARGLAENEGLGQRLAALDPAEAARLREVGQVETESLQNVAASVRGAKVKGVSKEDADNVKNILETVVLSSGRASGGFIANFSSRLVQRFRVPPTAALKLAEAVTDPARTDEAIAILNRLGVEPRAVAELAQAASRGAARGSGAAGEDE